MVLNWLIIVIAVVQKISIEKEDIKCTNTQKFGTLEVGKVYIYMY